MNGRDEFLRFCDAYATEFTGFEHLLEGIRRILCGDMLMLHGTTLYVTHLNICMCIRHVLRVDCVQMRVMHPIWKDYISRIISVLRKVGIQAGPTAEDTIVLRNGSSIRFTIMNTMTERHISIDDPIVLCNGRPVVPLELPAASTENEGSLYDAFEDDETTKECTNENDTNENDIVLEEPLNGGAASVCGID